MPVRTADGEIYDELEPKDSFKWGLMGGVLLGDYGNAEVGFMWSQQLSTLQVTGTTTREIGDLTVSSYHGYFGYNFFENDASARPYIFGGLGATSYGGVDYTRVIGGAAGHVDGETQFSTTWGAGVKFYAGNIGARIGVQWTPTYIKSDPAGYWCDPYWGCYLVGDPRYLEPVRFRRGHHHPLLIRVSATRGDLSAARAPVRAASTAYRRFVRVAVVNSAGLRFIR